MVRRTYTQRTLVEVLLPDADKLWDPVLRQISTLSSRTRSWWIRSRRPWGAAIP